MEPAEGNPVSFPNHKDRRNEVGLSLQLSALLESQLGVFDDFDLKPNAVDSEAPFEITVTRPCNPNLAAHSVATPSIDFTPSLDVLNSVLSASDSVQPLNVMVHSLDTKLTDAKTLNTFSLDTIPSGTLSSNEYPTYSVDGTEIPLNTLTSSTDSNSMGPDYSLDSDLTDPSLTTRPNILDYSLDVSPTDSKSTVQDALKYPSLRISSTEALDPFDGEDSMYPLTWDSLNYPDSRNGLESKTLNPASLLDMDFSLDNFNPTGLPDDSDNFNLGLAEDYPVPEPPPTSDTVPSTQAMGHFFDEDMFNTILDGLPSPRISTKDGPIDASVPYSDLFVPRTPAVKPHSGVTTAEKEDPYADLYLPTPERPSRSNITANTHFTATTRTTNTNAVPRMSVTNPFATNTVKGEVLKPRGSADLFLPGGVLLPSNPTHTITTQTTTHPPPSTPTHIHSLTKTLPTHPHPHPHPHTHTNADVVNMVISAPVLTSPKPNTLLDTKRSNRRVSILPKSSEDTNKSSHIAQYLPKYGDFIEITFGEYKMVGEHPSAWIEYTFSLTTDMKEWSVICFPGHTVYCTRRYNDFHSLYKTIKAWYYQKYNRRWEFKIARRSTFHRFRLETIQHRVENFTLMMRTIAKDKVLTKEKFVIDWFDEELNRRRLIQNNLNSTVIVNTAALSLLDPSRDDTVLNNYQY